MSVLYEEIQPEQVYGWEQILPAGILLISLIFHMKILIPYGVQNEDYIQIFKTIANTMDVKGKELYIDVTHGFRSIPLYIFSP